MLHLNNRNSRTAKATFDKSKFENRERPLARIQDVDRAGIELVYESGLADVLLQPRLLLKVLNGIQELTIDILCGHDLGEILFVRTANISCSIGIYSAVPPIADCKAWRTSHPRSRPLGRTRTGRS